MSNKDHEQHEPQAKLTLVLGGLSSGKSLFAESLVEVGLEYRSQPVIYLATLRTDDEECARKIRLHRERRPAAWTTYEVDHRTCALSELARLCTGSIVLLDGLGQYISLLLWDGREQQSDQRIESGDRPVRSVDTLINMVRDISEHLIVVSDDIGSSLVPTDALARTYTELLGRTNQHIARLADTVYMVEAGIPRMLKGGTS